MLLNLGAARKRRPGDAEFSPAHGLRPGSCHPEAKPKDLRLLFNNAEFFKNVTSGQSAKCPGPDLSGVLTLSEACAIILPAHATFERALMLPSQRIGLLLTLFAASTITAFGEDWRDQIRSTVEKSTLNQPGTPPFHLRAELSSYRPGIEPTSRTGTIEIWWVSPTQWKREIESPQFHQLAIMNNGKEWQHNDSDYLPEWLREITDDLLDPIPDLNRVLDESGGAGNWQSFSTDGSVRKSVGCGLSVSGLLTFGTCTGWGGEFSNFQSFGNRIVARTISGDGATARVTALENLDPSSVSFTPPSETPSSPLIHTVILDEILLRKNLQPSQPPQWPAVQDGPLEGVLTTTYVTVDRTGAVRDVGTILSDSPWLNNTAKEYITGLRFKPFVVNGEPVQVVSRITMPFKIVRPAGVETFDSARNYFEHGRKVNSPAFSGAKPYVLHATIQVYTEGGILKGEYTDTWKADDEWKREAKIGESYFARSRNGEKYYQLMTGNKPVLPPELRSSAGAFFTISGFVLEVIEPIPPTDDFYEADWKIRRDNVDGSNAIRVLSGVEPQNGVCDPEHAHGFWFDPEGRLIRFCERVDVRFSDFDDFNGAQVPQTIRVLSGDKTLISIRVDEMRPLDPGTPNGSFDLPSAPRDSSFMTAIAVR
jgi:hypothetical protein